MALNSAAIIAPDSVSRIGLCPRPANSRTPTEATNAPANANNGIIDISLPGSTSKPNTTNNAAPLLMPRMPGSANGLSPTACMIAPASPRLAPTSIATSRRGKRLPRMTLWSGLPGA
ncbi:hypothetical protein D3C78_1032050 [compost metagenome]